MLIRERVATEIVFTAADVWRLARKLFSAEFPGFSVRVGRRETPGRFAGGGLGAGLMLIVQDADGYELDYGERALFEACKGEARAMGYAVPDGAAAELCRAALDPFCGKALPDDPSLEAVSVRAHVATRTAPAAAMPKA